MKIRSQLLLTLFSFITLAVNAQSIETKTIIIDQSTIAYKLLRPAVTRKSNEPIVVFESGVGGGGFEQLLEFLPGNITGIQYERNGIGQSTIDTTIQTDAQVVERLHKLLVTLQIKPPYLLVGHSLGGAFIRLFAAKYPGETCGLVFIDPTDFMLTAAENETAKKNSGSVTGYREIWTINLKAMSADTTMPAGVRYETKREYLASTPVYFKEYQLLPPLKDIPVTVIIAYNKPIEPYEEQMNQQLQLGINIKPWWKEYDHLRITHYNQMISNNHNSKVILLPGYSHGIHYQDPKLVANAVADTFAKCVETENK